MTFTLDGSRRTNRAWHMPRSHDDLVTRRRALTAWAELHHGFMGRSPDHVASCVTGQAMGAEVFPPPRPRPVRPGAGPTRCSAITTTPAAPTSISPT